jgi:Baseplate J-like protein
MTFRRRTFPEVLDGLLTSITQGVAGEEHPFPPPGAAGPPFRHQLLQPPATAVVSVYGSRNGEPHEFRPTTDFRLVDPTTVEWQPKGDLPDAGTLVSVDYYSGPVGPALTDLSAGSVLRTLSEAAAREIAALYAQLDAVYQAGFIDTATGSALDRVVALLGIERVRGGRASGEVEFTRSDATPGTITIPAGTRIITPDGNVEYETTESVTLAAGQAAVRVSARDLETNPPVRAGDLSVLPAPIAGITAVSNPAPTALSTADEDDDQLRTRAKNFLHGSERATLASIEGALAREGIAADVEELGGMDASGQVTGTPGVVEITPHAESLPPEQVQRLLTAIQETRPAGVLVRLKGVVPPSKVNLSLRLTTADGLIQQDLRGIHQAVQDAVAAYFDRLPAKQAGSLNQLVGLVLAVTGVQDVTVESASLVAADGTATDVLDPAGGTLHLEGVTTVLGELRLTDPALPTSLDVTVTFPSASAPADEAAIRSSMSDTLAYLNQLNATALPATASDADRAARSLPFGKFLLATPLPGKPAQSLRDYDQAATKPNLPTKTSVAPYVPRFVLTGQAGASRVLGKTSDPPYDLAPGERLSLSSVRVAKSDA